MKAVRIIFLAVIVYAGVVVAFESFLGYYQPSSQDTIVITTTDADGDTHDRVVSRLESGDRLYVAANHWPRAWYRRALAEPEVSVTSDGETRAYRAVPVTAEEYDRIQRDYPVGPVGRFLMGFPPRRVVRLDPVAAVEPTGGASWADVGVTARLHFNTQTSDFARSRAFYRMLGFTAGVGGFPRTNTHQMARSLGMYELCSYEIRDIEVIALPDSWGPANMDLIQFAVPFNPAPPYGLPNHLGMAYAALLTTDLAADVAHLSAQGVEFLSEPYGVPGDRFVFFKDPDGVLFKLVETAPPHGDPSAQIHIRAMPYVALNVSDLDRSLAFYRTLGYTEARPFQRTGGAAEGRAHGLDGPFTLRGADIAIPRGDHHRLRLVQWVDPYDDDPPYPPPINHIGIHRIALAVPDLDRAVALLDRQGAEFLSEIAPCCSGTGEDETGIINLADPDGIFVELVGPIRRRAPVDPPEWCRGAEPR